ncbi:hypothetical protein CASFOL_025535 [Castilleja foliolosa]|uniref:Uncharacterized protein n=1 Tax=Castilleja foliolosa TaxID=1961234 RepID=A0ABD3CT91_9LAMI
MHSKHFNVADVFAKALSLFLPLSAAVTVNSIGVNYGTLGDNLPPPALSS